MIVLLDTNVVSELIRKAPDPAVEAWAASHPLEALFFSAVGEAELRYGAAILPTGRRRETLVSDNREDAARCFQEPSVVLRQGGGARICGHRSHAPFRRSPRRTSGLPDRGNRPLP